ncbi:MAG: FG-GAP-like repeat-containing protein [Gilvibacter sp.]
MIRILLLVFIFSTTVQGQILFEESAASLGYVQNRNIFEGTGISFADFDGDGWDDITVPSNLGEPVYFYKNNGGTFSQVSFTIDDQLSETKAVVWVDFDNDGDKDLFVSSPEAPNQFYRNDDFVFTDITASAGLPTTAVFTHSASWGDYDNDGFLDVFLANKDLDMIIPNMLYHNDGDGTFTLANTSSNIGDRTENTFQGTFYDINNDGWMELYLINDRIITKNVMYKNTGSGTFNDISFFSGTDYQMAAMSAAIQDYDYDGFIDMYITNTTYDASDPVPGNVLMKNNGDETFSNQAAPAAVRFDYFSWGAVWLDGDNDSYPDFYVSGQFNTTGGGILPSAYYDNIKDGRFERIPDQGFEDDLAFSYGNAIGDVNNDGFADIIVSNGEPDFDYIWLNKTSEINDNGYLKVNLEGTISNRDGVGAKIEILVNGKTQYRFTATVEGYLSQNSSTEFFGLSNATIVDMVKVYWPSGIVDEHNDLAINQTIKIIEDGPLLSVDTKPANFEARLYPNPAQDEVSVRLPNSMNVDVKVYNMLGQLVLGEQKTASSFSLNIADWPSGSYIVSIESEEASTRKILIKQ